MSIDITRFHQTFFEESFEGLDSMEAALLHLDIGAAEVETIHTIFRAAHSIKGGSGTFGFHEVTAFTHVVETLLDEMRDGRRQVTQEVVDLLLQAVDCLRAMLNALRDGEAIETHQVAKLQQQFEQLLQSGTSVIHTSSSAPGTRDPAATTAGWHIAFRPHPSMLQSGNDVVRMFRELLTLGSLSARVDMSRLPAFADLPPEECWLAWQLTLHGDIAREQVDEVFAWVEGECELEMTPLQATSEARAWVGEDPPTGPQPEPMAHAAPVTEERRVGGERRSGAERRAGAATTESGSIRVSIDKIDSLINIVGEQVIIQSMLCQLGEDFDLSRLDRLREGLDQLERNTRELQESVMRIRMLPISFAFNRLPRMVRDMSQQLGKQVELSMAGEQTELDKTVMEKIGDPLVHLVRNALDHGIETPSQRQAAGKPPTGKVHLEAYHQGGNIVIEIRDDGAGLSRQKILHKAKTQGLIGEDEALTDERVYELIFQPGFSTAETVSDISGRGVGMDVVRRNIRELGGHVEVRSQEGQGTTFTIRLPLTLAILDGQLVRVGDQLYVFPLVSIIESLQIEAALVNAIANQAELFKFRDQYIPLRRLYELFHVKPDSTVLANALLVVVEAEGQSVGIVVDELLGQQQVVIKSLETNFKRIEGIAGATILGDGTVALILDIAGLVTLSQHHARPPHPSPHDVAA